MSDEGANLTVVENGLQAVRMFQEKPEGYFDAILMDIMMPVIDGLTATNSIRSLNHPDAKKIPIIAMTANAFKKDKEKCLAAEMNAHLPKPIEIENVKKVLCEQIKPSFITKELAFSKDIFRFLLNYILTCVPAPRMPLHLPQLHSTNLLRGTLVSLLYNRSLRWSVMQGRHLQFRE